jgi:hypothetical protein
MKELEYKHNVMDLLKGLKFKVQAHEDKISNFIPDLSFSFARRDGWIEMKYLNRAPKTLDAIGHYTHGQQEWLTTRGAVGSGHCYLWVGTPNAHFLWRWSDLGAIRHLPWTEAAASAMVERDINGLCRGLAAVVRRSSS